MHNKNDFYKKSRNSLNTQMNPTWQDHLRASSSQPSQWRTDWLTRCPHPTFFEIPYPSNRQTTSQNNYPGTRGVVEPPPFSPFSPLIPVVTNTTNRQKDHPRADSEENVVLASKRSSRLWVADWVLLKIFVVKYRAYLIWTSKSFL